MNISINCHSSIRIEAEDKIIYIDPFKIKDELHDATHILITHDHYDHYSIEDINKVRSDKSILITPKCLDGDIKLAPYDEFDFIKAVPSFNVNKDFHKKEYGYLGYILNLFGKIIYIAGDTDNKLELNCDIALIPIGGTYTFDYVEASHYINKLKPKVVIPTHYGSIVGSIDLGYKFKELLDKEIICDILIEKDQNSIKKKLTY